MPRLRRKPKVRIEALTDGQLDELACGVGGGLDYPEDPTYGPETSRFESPLLRRAAWYAYKDLVMAEARPLSRPWAWWAYEQHDPDAAYAPNEAARLEALGVLSDLERGLLEGQRRDAAEAEAKRQQWYREYDAKRAAASTSCRSRQPTSDPQPQPLVVNSLSA